MNSFLHEMKRHSKRLAPAVRMEGIVLIFFLMFKNHPIKKLVLYLYILDKDTFQKFHMPKKKALPLLEGL